MGLRDAQFERMLEPDAAEDALGDAAPSGSSRGWGWSARTTARLDAAPADPRAVFVNGATIALQVDSDLTGRLTDYCDRADCAVFNAFESDELGTDSPVSNNERAALDALRAWADGVVDRS